MPFLPVGGQAVIEGVMMRSPSKVAVAVRRSDGTLGFFEREFISVTRRYKLLALPVIRGAVSLFETMYLGITALNFSADEVTRDEERAKAAAAGVAPTNPNATGDSAPVKPRGGMQRRCPDPHRRLLAGAGRAAVRGAARRGSPAGWDSTTASASASWTGCSACSRFILYLLLISQWKELARVLGYHGAEHKAIHALENRAPLTPESVQSFPRLHPRCGTSFLFLVVVISIVAFTFIGRPHGDARPPAAGRLRCRLIAGVAFEFIRLSGRYADQPLVRWLVWPGMQFQRLTTREPDLSMCEWRSRRSRRCATDQAVVALEARGDAGRAEVAFVQ